MFSSIHNHPKYINKIYLNECEQGKKSLYNEWRHRNGKLKKIPEGGKASHAHGLVGLI